MSISCPSAKACPIFNGILKGKEYTTTAYKNQFCEAGEKGRNSCLRWQCKQKFGKVPEKLLPNTNKTLKQVAEEDNL